MNAITNQELFDLLSDPNTYVDYDYTCYVDVENDNGCHCYEIDPAANLILATHANVSEHTQADYDRMLAAVKHLVRQDKINNLLHE